MYYTPDRCIAGDLGHDNDFDVAVDASEACRLERTLRSQRIGQSESPRF